MPQPPLGEKFIIQVRRRRNKPSATFHIEVQDVGSRRIFRVTNVDYPVPSRQRTLRREMISWYWYPPNPVNWWDSGSWHRLLVKATKDRERRLGRA